MRLEPLPIDGAHVVLWDPHIDERGWFARTWCAEEFEHLGLDARLVQCNSSFNERQGTLRGMHLQAPPAAETKLVRCTRGRVYDVLVDLRRDSSTFLGWTSVTLDEDDHRAVYVPEGVAHGFLTLADRTEVAYQMSAPYDEALATGVRWDDPAFGIEWPSAPIVISPRDASMPDFHQ